MKVAIIVLLGLLCLSFGKKFPTTHSEFYSTPNDKFILGYFLDWGHGPFDPTVPTGGLSRLNDLDLLLYSFITTTYDVNIVWGGKGYANGDLVEGYFADNNCTMYNGQEFEGSFCKTWQPTGFCDAAGLECPINKPKGGWCASERFNPIAAQSAQKQQPFGISIGGWSDTIDTPYTTEAATTLGNNIVSFINGINNACGGQTIITAVDFDWEHLSDPDANGTRDERIAAYAVVVSTVRQALPDIIISYCTRFNAFLDYEQDGKPFASNKEGFAVAQAFTNLGLNIADVFTFVNIMAYDTPPSVISPQGWTIEAYTKILQSFDNRYGGLFAPSQLVMGLETGQQAAGGIYEGYERAMCLINYINNEQYKGVMIWAPNQFTYRYLDQDNQVACNFTGQAGFNETAWNIGWPSGTDPKNPNCKFYPINTTSPQFNGPMADCIENIGPFIANQAQQVFDGTLQIPDSYCSAPSWNPCNWCPPNSVREGSNCVCASGYIMVNNTCVQCKAPEQIIDGVCQCPISGQTLVNGQCQCQNQEVVINGKCSSCPSDQVFQNGKCVCKVSGQVVVNGQCACPSGQVVINGACGTCPSDQVYQNGQCVCKVTGQTVVNGQCQCPSGQVVINGACGTCPADQVYQNGQCVCKVSGQVIVNGQCACPSGQVVINGACGTCPADQVYQDGQCVCKVSGQTVVNGQCACPSGEYVINGACGTCPSGQVYSNGQCVCQISGQTIVNGQCQCPSGDIVVDNKCTPQPVVCPENSQMVPNCPVNRTLTDGCCCAEGYYADGNVCMVVNPTCNCTQWMVTPEGKIYGIPVSWCYTDCYAPDAYPIGLHIACSRFLYYTYPNGTTVLTNQSNAAHQFCGCTQQDVSGTGKCNNPPPSPSMFLRRKK